MRICFRSTEILTVEDPGKQSRRALTSRDGGSALRRLQRCWQARPVCLGAGRGGRAGMQVRWPHWQPGSAWKCRLGPGARRRAGGAENIREALLTNRKFMCLVLFFFDNDYGFYMFDFSFPILFYV